MVGSIGYCAPEYLVTGAAGFLGSQMVEHLLKEGKSVRATDIITPWWLDKYPIAGLNGDLEFVPADLTDPESLKKAVAGTKKAFHFGALFNHSAKKDDLMKINAKGTDNLMKLASGHGLERVIHMGSMSVYGHDQVADEGESYAITEQKRPNPADPYARSKQESREIAAYYNGMRGMKVAGVDPAGIFGPYSTYGNAKLIDMLLDGMMVKPDGGKHKASMIHSVDVIGVANYLMNYENLSKSNDAQEIFFLASDTTPVTGKELMEMMWEKIPQEMRKEKIRWITEKLPIKKWYVMPLAKMLKQYDAGYGFGDHSASPENIMSLGFRHKFPRTQETVADVMEWHETHEEGMIFKKRKK